MSKKYLNQLLAVSLVVSFFWGCADHKDLAPQTNVNTAIEETPAEETPIHQQALVAIQKSDKYFKQFGKLQKFEWVPKGYQNGFVYDIYYYIPKSIANTKNSPALIFMHGGGASTMTRAGANEVVGRYTSTVATAAEKYKFIAVLPSSNGLNWGSHTDLILSELSSFMRDQLNFDTDRLGLSGHSMGGMGIGRNYQRVVNDFSFANSISSAIALGNQTEERISKMFNIKYCHQQGTKDHFPEFITWNQALEKKVKSIETKYNSKAKFEIEWFNDAHVYTDAQTKKLEALFREKREIFQKNLYGQIYLTDKDLVENFIKFHAKGNNRYLWLENIPVAREDIINFILESNDNQIHLKFATMPLSKVFKVYLSLKIFDLDKNIPIYVNGKQVAEYKAKAASKRKSGLITANDPASKYDDVFEFSF